LSLKIIERYIKIYYKLEGAYSLLMIAEHNKMKNMFTLN